METRYREIRIAKYHGVIALSTINHAANTASVSSSYPDASKRRRARRPSSLVLVLPFFVAPMFSRPRRKRTPGDIIATTAASKWRIPGGGNGWMDGWMERNEIEGGALSFLRLMAEIAFNFSPASWLALFLPSFVQPSILEILSPSLRYTAYTTRLSS